MKDFTIIRHGVGVQVCPECPSDNVNVSLLSDTVNGAVAYECECAECLCKWIIEKNPVRKN